ncbi:MAG: RDD family protein [Betaproteobacteria bacterium]
MTGGVRPQAQAPAVSSAAPAPPASLGRRLAALTYEATLASALVVVVGFLTAPLVSPGPAGAQALRVPELPARVIAFCAIFATGAAYFVWSWTGGRRTLPMKTWHLAVVGADGRPPDRRAALARYLAAWIGPACALGAYAALAPSGLGAHAVWLVGLNFLWAFVDPERRFLHDRIAGTRIVTSP